VEQKFSILYRYIRSLLNQVKISVTIKHNLWAEAAHHATDSLHLVCTVKNFIPPYKNFYGIDPPATNNLHTFGELVATANKIKITAKSTNCGMIALYIG
jgi:hypothetical protein